MIVDQTSWGCVRVTGADRVRFLQGMCMGNVATIPVGGWLRTATLSPKGRVLSIYDVVAREGELLLLPQPGLADAVASWLERHAIADDVALERTELPVHRVWDAPAAVWSAPPVFEPATGRAATADEVEVRRIEGGLPLYGVDVSEDNFPFETPLATVIDYKKGCYVGQEPVARVHARGTPSKRLVGLLADTALAAGEALSLGGKEVGQVTSACTSPSFGTIALGYLARQAWEPGTTVDAAGGQARVVATPFR